MRHAKRTIGLSVGNYSDIMFDYIWKLDGQRSIPWITDDLALRMLYSTFMPSLGVPHLPTSCWGGTTWHEKGYCKHHSSPKTERKLVGMLLELA